ncbi:MAG: phosphoribosyltransferase family protein [Sporomusaceae bacterium]|nr:phosphoribosyltransferase family protein [Sporomusaceae bacterium]
MNSTISPACLPDCHSYDILGNLKVKVFVKDNVYQIPVDALFLMAARKNTKRGFLFVSTILGKHIPVHPLIPLIGGAALAGRYASMVYNENTFEENCNFAQALVSPEVREKTWDYIRQNPLPLREKTLFIGFAETATALGHAMFSCFSENAQYIHTTRENILGIDNVLNFTEEHSHATEHYCYAIDPALFDNEDMIILVDDEITTGKSALNFIKAIQRQYPRKKYGVVSILDWRSADDRQRLIDAEHELGITIHCISLTSGNISVTGEPVTNEHQPKQQQPSSQEKPVVERIALGNELGPLLELSSFNTNNEINTAPYLRATGRFGINSKEQADLESNFQQIGLCLKQKRQGHKTLCLGTGEFMYIPFKIASYMGEGVTVQSTTRSPIHPAEHTDYGVQQAISFASPDDHSIINYLYNIPAGYYDEVFIFLERAVDDKALEPLMHALAPLAIPKIICVSCVGIKE